MAVSHQDVLDLGKWIESLAPVAKVSRPLLPEPVELADALVVIATTVTCEACGEKHISSSHVMKRVPKRDGSVAYKPARFNCLGLPHVVEWAAESIEQCWRCFDLAERLLDPEANLAVAPAVLTFEPEPVEKL